MPLLALRFPSFVLFVEAIALIREREVSFVEIPLF
jgi:hypothetical protein